MFHRPLVAMALSAVLIGAALSSKSSVPVAAEPPAPSSARALPAYRTVVIPVGDTLAPFYAIPTDTVLAVSGYRVVCKRGGLSAFRFRLYRRTAPTGAALGGDSIPVFCGDSAAFRATLPVSCDSILTANHVSLDTTVTDDFVKVLKGCKGRAAPSSAAAPTIQELERRIQRNSVARDSLAERLGAESRRAVRLEACDRSKVCNDTIKPPTPAKPTKPAPKKPPTL